MKTDHRVVTGDARDLALPDDSVELVVTSPPYPMIEMWDDIFIQLDPAVETALADGDGERAFDLMHDVLDTVWAEITRVVVPGGIVCVNVGDATRSIGDGFRSFPNHCEITQRLSDRGLRALPDILWRKPSNRATKFLGSGMIPPNAYPTLEHEHILVFRNGRRRSFPPGDEARYESAYFWEERNEWFSDLWDLRGESQALDESIRERSGAFPFDLPYRLISMFSIYGDTVLDPFLGTGTTTLAAMVAGRDSVGYDRDGDLLGVLDERVADVTALSHERGENRLIDHQEWVHARNTNGTEPSYDAVHYDTSVTTKQEQQIHMYAIEDVEETADGYRTSHVPIEHVPTERQ